MEDQKVEIVESAKAMPPIPAELAKVPTEEEATAKLTEADDGEEVFVAARTVQEMNIAQVALVKWADKKIAKLKEEKKAADVNLELAKTRKWATDPFKRISALAQKKTEFYEKVKAALEAGYTIIPNMPMDIFAVRTTRKSPKEHRNSIATQFNGRAWVKDQETNHPPLGEGKYVSNRALEEANTWERKDKEGKIIPMETRWAEEFQEEIDFPFKLAKPVVLNATAQALALRIFDEIGGAPPKQSRRGDPMVIGSISYKQGYSEKRISFLVTWFIDSKDL